MRALNQNQKINKNMPTQAEEQQVRDFLKRVEIRTMKKDLSALREADALLERDKIAKIKTLEEQLALEKAPVPQKDQKADLQEVLYRNEAQEKIAEKDLKNYATEQERQQIFLMESERFNAETQIKEIDDKKDPALKLENNQALLQIKKWQERLNAIIKEEKEKEDEQKFLAEKSQTTAIPAERKALEQSRWDLDKKIQEIEKKRWEAEKQVQNLENNSQKINASSEALTAEKNNLRNKILGVDRSLREIYSGIMAREEAKRQGRAEEQKITRQAASEVRTKEREVVRRQQWTERQPGGAIPVPSKTSPGQGFRQKMAEGFAKEEEQRKQFLKNIEQDSDKK